MKAIKVIINGKEVELKEGQTLAQIIEQVVPAGKKIAVAINGRVIPKEKYPETPIREGDKIEIVQMVGGG